MGGDYSLIICPTRDGLVRLLICGSGGPVVLDIARVRSDSDWLLAEDRSEITNPEVVFVG